MRTGKLLLHVYDCKFQKSFSRQYTMLRDLSCRTLYWKIQQINVPNVLDIETIVPPYVKNIVET